MMNKTDLLFQMMEHPHAYTAQQWQEILMDEECRELYTLMAKTKSAFDSQKEVDDETIDAEWSRLTTNTSRSWLRVAALFVGVLMLSGITFAAIHIVRWVSTPEPQMVKVEHPIKASKATAKAKDNVETNTTDTIQSVVFDNVTFEKMLPEIAAKYNAEVIFQNAEAKQLRFYFLWKKNDNLHEVIEKLNMFSQVDITIEDEKLIVK